MKRYSIILTMLSFLSTISVVWTQDKMQVKDADSNVLMQVNDEGAAGSITLPGLGAVPSVFTNKIYSIGGELYYNGVKLSSLWSLNGLDVIYDSGSVGIGTAAPNSKAVLDVDASGNDKGVLLPRLTTAQRTAISGLGASEEGLLVYDESTDSFWFWSGSQWQEMGSAGLADNLGNHTATQTLNLSGNWLSGDGGSEGVFVADDGRVGIGRTQPTTALDIDPDDVTETDALHLRAGNPGAGFDNNQVLFTTAQGTATTHAIKSRHNSTQNATNALDFFMWEAGTDPVGAVGTTHIMSVTATGLGIGTTAPNALLQVGHLHYIGAPSIILGNRRRLWKHTVGANSGHYIIQTGTTDVLTLEDDGTVNLNSNDISNGGTVTATAFVGDGSGLTGISGDDLGNHTATQTLDLNSNDISNASTVTATAFVGDGSGLTGISGDNLGDHTATQTLDLNSNDISNADTVTATAFVGDGSGLTGITAPGDNLGNHTATQTLDLNSNDISNADTVTATAFVGDGSGLTGISAPGDNLGNHTATQTLDLNSNDVSNAGTVTATAFVGDGSGLTGISAPGDNLGNHTATQTLDLNSNDVSNADTVTATAFVGDGSGLTGISGDNLGNHTATQTLDLNSNDISNGGTVTATAFVGDGSGLTGISGDNLGDHIATQNLQLNGNYLSGDGGSEGVFVADDGNVGIGTAAPGQQLEITGNLQLPQTGIAGSDSAGILMVDGSRFIHSFGNNNFFAGKNAGNLSGANPINNTGVGESALTAINEGDDNTAVGFQALIANDAGEANTAVGSQALSATTTGNANTAVGGFALTTNQAGNQNTAIGFSANVSAPGLTNATAIGANAVVNASNKIQLGDANVTDVATAGTVTATAFVGDGSLLTNLSGGSSLQDADNDTKIQVEESADEDTIRFDVAGVEFAKMDGKTLHMSSPDGTSLFIGTNAGQNDDGTNNGNTLIGVNAGEANTTGSGNTASGSGALFSNTAGDASTASGRGALAENTTGDANTASGFRALDSNTTGSSNTALGFNADVSSGTLTNATAIGANAVVDASNKIQLGDANVTAVQTAGTVTAAAFVGDGSFLTNLSGGSSLQDADNDTKIQVEESADEDTIRFDIAGVEFAKMDGKTLHMSGPGNSLFIGTNAGQNDDGTDNLNTFIGVNVGQGNTSGDGNTAVGIFALKFNTTGSNITASGGGALISNTTGNNNTASGSQALALNTTGSQNTASGDATLFFNTTGSTNTANGSAALSSNTTGSSNTALGFNADVSSGTLTNATAIGANAVVDTSNKIQLGDANVTAVATAGTVTAAAFVGDGSGLTGISAPGDNLGNHTATQTLNLSGNYLSGNGGSEGVFVAANGDVGIGTNSPGSDLEIQANTTSTMLHVNNVKNTTGTIIGNVGPFLKIDGGTIADVSGSTTGMEVDVSNIGGTDTYSAIFNGGNVGIGTNSPEDLLHVGSSTQVGAQSIVVENDQGKWSHTVGSGGAYNLQDAGTTRMFISTSGAVGIGTSAPHSDLQVDGSFATKVTITNSNLTLDDSHSIVLASASATITLPSASGISGRSYTIKMNGPGAVTIQPQSGEKVDLFSSIALAILEYRTIVSDGSNWWIVASN